VRATPPPLAGEPVGAPGDTTAAVPASTIPPPAGIGGSTSQATEPMQLAIAAQADCWLMVKVDDGVVFNRILLAGEALAYRAYASVTLIAGNAGGLSLAINGRRAIPLGAPGQVVTTTITPGTLASFLQ
jgi:cytoskeleton protein RodZ